jgi:hypothetical protein
VLRGINLPPGSRDLTISGADLWSAVNHSLLAAAPVILGASVADGSQIESFSYDEFFNVLNATWPRSPIEYRDFDTLSNDIRRLFDAAANQIAARYLSRELANTTAGSYTIIQIKVVLLDISLRVVEAGIALIIVCACMMALHSPWVPCSGASDSTALLAVVIARSDRLRIGYVVDNNWQRLTQSKISTRILQALLAAMWLCTTIALVLFDTKNLIPKNPCSIAPQASLLADSKFLDLIPAGAENATPKELMERTPFIDHVFTMGWWDDDSGGRRSGTDVGKAGLNKEGDDKSQEEGGVDVEMVDLTMKDGYRAVGELIAGTSVDLAEPEI